MTISDLKNYVDKLVEQGKGDRQVKFMYDGMIAEIDEPAQVFREMEADGRGVISGNIKKGEFLIQN